MSLWSGRGGVRYSLDEFKIHRFKTVVIFNTFFDANFSAVLKIPGNIQVVTFFITSNSLLSLICFRSFVKVVILDFPQSLIYIWKYIRKRIQLVHQFTLVLKIQTMKSSFPLRVECIIKMAQQARLRIKIQKLLFSFNVDLIQVKGIVTVIEI